MNQKTKLISLLIIGFILGGMVHHHYKFVPKKMHAWTAEKAAHQKAAPLVWTMVNVSTAHKQGDAHLIESKGAQKILIDAGFYVNFGFPEARDIISDQNPNALTL